MGARSEDEIRRTLVPLEAEGWRPRHSLPWRGRGEDGVLVLSIDCLLPALLAANFPIERVVLPF